MKRLMIRPAFLTLLVVPPVGYVAAAQLAWAAPPTTAPAERTGKDYGHSSVVTRMMAFDKDHDGKLTRAEVTDERLQPLFDQADANGDGVVTKEELTALAAKLDAADGPSPDDRGPGDGGPGGFGGGPGDGGPGGPGGPDDRGGPVGRRPGFGPGRFGGPPPLGQILPPPARDALQLTDEQKRQLDALQAEVDRKLAAILTDEQNKQLAQMKAHGPGGRRGPGGPPPPDGQ